jgi:GNAT superfamily N-acetyltransferase
MNTLIREASPADLEAMIEISRRTISAAYRLFLGDEAVDRFLDSGAADRYVVDHLAGSLVILLDGAVAGFAVWLDDTIDLMLIDYPLHRHGLGTTLLGRVEQMMARQHAALRLESFEANEPANAFYQKNGWREVSRYIDGETGISKIVFQKSPGAITATIRVRQM